MTRSIDRGTVTTTAAILRAAGITREQLGDQVRRQWIEWAQAQPHPKPSWLVPFARLSPADREADMAIGENMFRVGWEARHRAGPRPCHCLCATAHPQAEGICDVLNGTTTRTVQVPGRPGRQEIQVCQRCADAAVGAEAAAGRQRP